MYVRTAKDVGALIRDQRKKQKIDQAELAEKIGSSRRWVIEVEQGKPRASINLILKAFDALGLTMLVQQQDAPSDQSGRNIPDIDAIIDKAKGGRS